MAPVQVSVKARIEAAQAASSAKAKLQALFPNLYQMGRGSAADAFWDTQITKYIDTNPRASRAQRLYE